MTTITNVAELRAAIYELDDATLLVSATDEEGTVFHGISLVSTDVFARITSAGDAEAGDVDLWDLCESDDAGAYPVVALWP